METARIVSVLHSDIVKIHSLYIAKDSQMAEDYLAGRLTICSKEEYFECVRVMLENLDPSIAIERCSVVYRSKMLFSVTGESAGGS